MHLSTSALWTPYVFLAHYKAYVSSYLFLAISILLLVPFSLFMAVSGPLRHIVHLHYRLPLFIYSPLQI